jgi:hypothetical protein
MANIKELSTNLNGLSEKVIALKAKLKGLQEGSDKHLAATKKLNVALKQQAAAMSKLDQSGKSLTKNNKKHTNAIKQKTAALKKANVAQKQSIKQEKSKKGIMSSLTKGFGPRLVTLGKYLVATKLIQLAIQAIGLFTVTAAKRAIAFDGALGDLGAVTGQSGDELREFGEIAQRTAGATKLTAVEVVALQKELAKLGTSAIDIAKLTLPIAQLSQALGESGADVAKIFKSITNQFGLTTLASVDLAGTILKTTTSSALNLTTLGTGMGYVGTQASIMNLSVEETAANLAILADNGLSASKAGTGFRNVLIAAVKSGKSYDEFIDGLAEKGLSAGDAIKLFGKRAAAAGLLLVRNREEVIKLTAGLNDNEAVLAATIQQMGSAKGVTEQLTSAWGNLLINIGDGIAKSNLFIIALKLINKEAGLQAELFKGIKDGGIEAQNQYLTIARIADGFKGTKIESVVDVDRIKRESAILAETLDPDTFGRLRDKFEKQLASGVIDQDTDFFGFLTLNRDNNISEYKSAWDDINFVTSEGIKEGIKLGQGNADNSARELENVARITKEAEVLRAAARANKLDEDAVEQFVENVDIEIAAAEKQLAFDKAIADAAQKSYDNDPDNERTQRKLINSAAILNTQQAEVDILKKQRVDVQNLANDEIALAAGREQSFRLQLDRLKRERKEALRRLALQEKIDELAVNSEEERRDFELKYSKERGDINTKYAGQLENIIALNQDATNIEGARNLLQTWNGLADISQEAVGQVGDAISGMGKLIDDYIKEQTSLVDSGEITLDDANANLDSYVGERKRILKLFIADLVATAGLTKEASLSILSAIDAYEAGEVTGGVDKKKNPFLEDQAQLLAKEALAVFKDFGKEKLDNLKSQADNELDVIKERYSIEEDILKSNLDNQIITESQFRVKSAELKKAQIAEENSVNRKLFEQQLKQDRANTVAAGLEAIARATILAFSTKDPFVSGPVQASIAAGVITATTGAKLAAIGTRKFYPKTFEDGGVVNGPSHAEGGVPFSVQGRGGYEMEGGEFIVNKRSASMHRELLDRINSSGRTSAVIGTQKFAQGGEVIGSQNTEGVEYLKLIAESSFKTAVNSDKPTRAFVSTKDLTTDSRERSIRNNNNRI